MKRRTLKLRVRAVVLAGAVAAALAAGPSAASATSSPVPFSDPNANGTLTLCNLAGEPVTSGSLLDVPFIWSAVSSAPAPKGYTRADMLVYQPIEHVDPSSWQGYQLTDNSIFSDPDHPVAQATYADFPLLYADESFPPYWNGLYELRMYFSGANKPELSSPYPAAVIQVTGHKWTLLSGGGTACNAGKAVSIESLMLPKSETEIPHPLASNTSAGHTSPTESPPTTKATQPGSGAATPITTAGSKGPAGKEGAGASSSTTSDREAAPTQAAAASTHSGGGSSAGLIAIVVAVVLIGGGSGAVLLYRRRRSMV